MWIKPLQVDHQGYVYSAWSNQIARVSPVIYERLTDDQAPAYQRSEAIRLGLLPTQSTTLAIYPEPMIAQALRDLERAGPVHLVLTVTESCNFRCHYCAYSGAYRYARRHSRRSMPLDTALTAIRWYLGFQRDHFHIGFYGGEPLLHPQLIEQAVQEAQRHRPGAAGLSFGMTTNGWLLEDRVIDFLAEQQFELFISLDGPAQVHDRYRRDLADRPTFSRVWNRVQRIAQRQPDWFNRCVGFSMTLAPPDALADVAAFIAENPEVFAGKVPRLGLLSDAPSQVQERLGIDPRQSHIDFAPLRARYLADRVHNRVPDGLSRACTEAAMARLERRYMADASKITSSGGQCAPGTRCQVAVDGTLHMCEHGDEHFPIGDVNTGFDQAAIRLLLRRFRELVEAHCQDCWAIHFCLKCIPRLAEGPLLSKDRLKSVCAAHRASIERDLADYCRARSQNENCFSSLGEPAEHAVSMPLN